MLVMRNVPGVSAGVPDMLLVIPDCAAMVTCNNSSALFIKLFTKVFVFAKGWEVFWISEFTSWKNFSLELQKGSKRSQVNVWMLSERKCYWGKGQLRRTYGLSLFCASKGESRKNGRNKQMIPWQTQGVAGINIIIFSTEVFSNFIRLFWTSLEFPCSCPSSEAYYLH